MLYYPHLFHRIVGSAGISKNVEGGIGIEIRYFLIPISLEKLRGDNTSRAVSL